MKRLKPPPSSLWGLNTGFEADGPLGALCFWPCLWHNGRMSMSFPILSTGACLPRRAWSNAELIAAKGLDSTPEWIESRTGIAQRYLAEEGETTFSLTQGAVEQALQRAGITPAEVGVLVVATCTPDLTFPSVAALVHGALGMPAACAVLDINAACSGFIHALAVAKGLLAASPARYAVVVGAETFSNLLDWNDRTTCVLFGDGAGAVVMGKDSDTGKGLLGVTLGADGACAPMLMTTGGVARGRVAGHILMNGREVFKHAVRQMGEVPPLLEELGLSVGDVDLLVPHQANARIIEAAAKALDLPTEKVVMTVGQHANTSAASIPLALDSAVRDGRLVPGKTVLLQAFGAGFAWSTAVVKW